MTAAWRDAWRDHPRIWIVALLGLIGCLIVGVLHPAGFFQAWLINWLFLLGIALAGMAQVMIHEITGGDWGRVLRPPLEAATATLPLIAVMAIPLAFGLPELFSWARPDAAHNELLRGREWYLSPASFIIREAILLVIWCVLGWLLLDRVHAAPTLGSMRRRRRVAVAGLLIYLVTVTIAATDWIAALVPAWYSTTLGVRLGCAQFVAALGFAVPFAAWNTRGPGSRPASARDYQDFGNLLLTCAMMWAYIAFTQYLIIWGEDLPREIAWYWPRASTTWRGLIWPVIILNFALPVAAMLFRSIKRTAVGMATVCGLALIGQWLDCLWLIAPSVRPGGFQVNLLDVLALIGMGLLWLGAVLALVARLPASSMPVAPERMTAHG